MAGFLRLLPSFTLFVTRASGSYSYPAATAMPKFDARQQQRKLRRHNPVATSQHSAAGSSSTAPADALPVLNNLPLPDSQLGPSTLEQDESIHRALLGLNPLLLAKGTRNILLNPKDRLLHRLLGLLDHARLEVRKETAGCLRNLCVEGPWSIREQIWQHGGGSRALAQIEYAAKELGLLPKPEGSAAVTASETSAKEAPAVPKKPQEMNRKERRHAAKASKNAGAEANVAPTTATVTATPASAAAEVEAHEVYLMHLSLLENHLTIIWCLLEGVGSPVWLTTLNRSPLGPVLCACLSHTASAYREEEEASANRITAKENKEIRDLRTEVGLTAANVLAAWLEDNPTAASAMTGLSPDLVEQVQVFEQAGTTSVAGSKGRKRLETILDRAGPPDAMLLEQASLRIKSLTSDFESLISPKASLDNERAITLGLLVLTSCVNMVSSLPKALRSWIVGSSEKQPLAKWLVSSAAPRVIEFLQRQCDDEQLWQKIKTVDTVSAPQSAESERLQLDSGMEVDLGQETAEEGDDGAQKRESASTVKVLKQLQNVSLAMELLGETCAQAEIDQSAIVAAPSHNGDESREPDDEMNGEDDLESDQEEEMLALAGADGGGGEMDDDEWNAEDAQGDASMDATASKKSKGSVSASTPSDAAISPVAALLSSSDLTGLGLQLLGRCQGEIATAPATSELVQATQGTLATVLSGLATHARPPPSQPLETGGREDRRTKQFQQWVVSQSERWSSLWSSLQGWTQRPGATTELLVAVWTSLNALLVMHEGLPSLPFALSADDMRSLFGSALDATLQAANTDAEAPTVAALIVNSLGCLARIPDTAASTTATNQEANRFACKTWLTLLASAPTVPGAVLLATMHAIIDTYADETMPWDTPVFVQDGVLAQLRTSVGGVREKVKTVDKRSHSALREGLDEALSNLLAFIEYRQGLAL